MLYYEAGQLICNGKQPGALCTSGTIVQIIARTWSVEAFVVPSTTNITSMKWSGWMIRITERWSEIIIRHVA